MGGEPEALVVVDEGGLAFATRYTDCPASIGARSFAQIGRPGFAGMKQGTTVDAVGRTPSPGAAKWE